jgi:predicted anti-sigma-YlaC factor YlaD
VSCGFSKELLALHVEGDLSEARAEMTSSHLRMCEDCRRFLDDLCATQSLLKSLRSETIRPSDCTPMRREVMSIIEDRREGLGWALRIERAIMLGFGLRSYAFAAVAMLAIVSVSVLAQLRQTTPATVSAAVFEGRNTVRKGIETGSLSPRLRRHTDPSSTLPQLQHLHRLIRSTSIPLVIESTRRPADFPMAL